MKNVNSKTPEPNDPRIKKIAGQQNAGKANQAQQKANANRVAPGSGGANQSAAAAYRRPIFNDPIFDLSTILGAEQADEAISGKISQNKDMLTDDVVAKLMEATSGSKEASADDDLKAQVAKYENSPELYQSELDTVLDELIGTNDAQKMEAIRADLEACDAPADDKDAKLVEEFMNSIDADNIPSSLSPNIGATVVQQGIINLVKDNPIGLQLRNMANGHVVAARAKEAELNSQDS